MTFPLTKDIDSDIIEIDKRGGRELKKAKDKIIKEIENLELMINYEKENNGYTNEWLVMVTKKRAFETAIFYMECEQAYKKRI